MVPWTSGIPSKCSPSASCSDCLLAADLIVAETVNVLESFYEAPRVQVADAMRSLIAFDSVVVVGQAIDRVDTVERVEPPA